MTAGRRRHHAKRPNAARQPHHHGADPGSAARVRPAIDPARTWSHEPHHRRRRTLRGAGDSGADRARVDRGRIGQAAAAPQPATIHRAGLFGPIQTLSGTGPELASPAIADRGRERGDRPHARVHAAIVRSPAPSTASSRSRSTTARVRTRQQLVSVLKQMDVPATFFEVGDRRAVLQRRDAATSSRTATRSTTTPSRTRRCPSCRSRPAVAAPPARRGRSDVTARPYPRLFRPPYGALEHDTLALLQAVSDADGPLDRRHERLPAARGRTRSSTPCSTAPSPARSS